VDAAGQAVPGGDHGEIQVKGDNVMSHYWNDSQATTDNLVDGWFKTGDVARCDADGNYWFSDRLKHVIISGGENIYAAEIERILSVIPGVREVSVVGAPDKKWGETPVAVVVVEDNGPDEAVILAACDGVIAHFKRPKRVVFTDTLPRNALGKVQVVQVRKLVTTDEKD
jgi:fatty-acyl-CoA synthase